MTEGVFDTLCGADGKCGATWNPQGFIVYNGWVTKFNVEGTALIYSGFLGDYAKCAGRGIAVDEAQQAYVTGDIGPNIMETVPLVPPKHLRRCGAIIMPSSPSLAAAAAIPTAASPRTLFL